MKRAEVQPALSALDYPQINFLAARLKNYFHLGKYAYEFTKFFKTIIIFTYFCPLF